MKNIAKNILFLAIVLLTVVLTQSCTKMRHDYTVTIIGKTTSEKMADKISTTFGNRQLYNAATPSGDTVQTFVAESVILSNPMPFKATMSKSPDSRYGYVKAAIGNANKTK